jgi:hypothetical protein
MTAPLRFCVQWLCCVIALLSSVAAWNAMVDPYDVIGTPRVPGFNAFKVMAPRHTLLAKSYQVRRVSPVTVLAGSSLVNIGLDPDSAVWPAAMRPVYNFGLPAADLAGIYRSLRYAYANGHVKYAIVALEFENFLIPIESAARDDGLPGEASLVSRLRDRFLATVPFAALQDSVRTVLRQRDHPALDLAPNGAIGEAGFIQLARRDGEYALFAKSVAEERAHVSRAAAMLATSHGTIPNLKVVGDIIDFCETHGIALTLLIPPSHAALLDIFDDAGLWRMFEAWKSALAQLAAAHGQRPVPLWDFSGYDAYSTERLPASGDRKTATSWYWDAVHFKRVIGEKILSRMLTGEPLGFGIPLKPENLAAHLAGEESDHAAYLCGRENETSGRRDYSRAPGCKHVSR